MNHNHANMITPDNFEDFLEAFDSNPFKVGDEKKFRKQLVDNIIKYAFDHMSLISEKPKPESALQTLFFCFIKAYGVFLNIDISRESNGGRGPVDFKCSQGYHNRVLIETKLVSNSKYWHGLERQLPLYMQSEEVNKGIFLLVAFSNEEYNKGNKYISKVNTFKLPYDIESMIVDASKNKPSASNL